MLITGDGWSRYWFTEKWNAITKSLNFDNLKTFLLHLLFGRFIHSNNSKTQSMWSCMVHGWKYQNTTILGVLSRKTTATSKDCSIPLRHICATFCAKYTVQILFVSIWKTHLEIWLPQRVFGVQCKNTANWMLNVSNLKLILTHAINCKIQQ